MFTLRPYQREANEALLSGWDAGKQRLAVVLPTGAGKTVVFSDLVMRLRKRGIARTLVLAHREELLEQAADKIRRMAPHLKVGIVQADRNEHINTDVVIASVQTLAYRKPCPNRRTNPDGSRGPRCNKCLRCTHLPRAQQIKQVGAVIVDEAHHAASPSYRLVLRYFGGFEPVEQGGIPVAGFTATMNREKGGLARVWQEVVYQRDIADMIEDGFLVRPHAKQVVVPGMDLNEVKKQQGDLVSTSLAQMMLDADAMSEIAKAYLEYASDRPGIVFSPTVEVAEAMTDAFNSVGLPTATVWGAMGNDARRSVLKGFANGSIQVLSNVMVLVEGFDEPKASCLVVARPTLNPGLYVQMAGRVLRPAPGKEDALILDVTGVATRHKLASIVDLTDKAKRSSRTGDGDDEEEEEEEIRQVATGMGRMIEKELLRIGGWRDVDILEEAKRARASRGSDRPEKARWLRTPQGHRIVAADTKTYFLVPGLEEGQYHLRVTIDGLVNVPPGDPSRPLAEAMDELNRLGLAHAGPYDDISAPWRAKKPSQRMLDLAAKMRLPVAEGMRAGEVSDLIDGRKRGVLVDAEMLRHEKKLNELRG